jgi:YVTN family beta-propeller protein
MMGSNRLLRIMAAVMLVVPAACAHSSTQHSAQESAVTRIVHLTDADRYVPATLTIHVGDVVRWVNDSHEVHTVTDLPSKAAYREDASLPPGAEPFNSGYLKPGTSYEHRFTVPGRYTYFCIPHESPGMVGSVMVLSADQGSTASGPSHLSTTTAPARSLRANPALFPSPVYVTLQRTGAIEAFPSERVFTGFPQAHYISSSPHGRLLLISGFQNGDAYVADARSGRKIATVHIGGLLQGVKIDPSGRYGFVVDASAGTVAVLALHPVHLLRRIPVGKVPHNVIFAPDDSRAYVTIQGGRALAVIDMRSLALRRTIPLPQVNGPHNLDIDPSGTTVWIRSHAHPQTDGEVAMVDLRSGNIVHLQHVGLYHGGIDVRPLTPYVFTADIGGDTLDVLDRTTLAIVKRLVVGTGPHGVRVSPNGAWVYVTDTRANRLVVVDAKTLRIVQSIPVAGENPFWLAVVGNE